MINSSTEAPITQNPCYTQPFFRLLNKDCFLAIKEIEDKQTQQMEIKMTAKEVNAFDAIREIAIKFMDTAKVINQLASEIDVKLSDVEKEMADNVKDTEKLKQLQSLLKSLG